MKEIWKDIIGYEGLYKISNYGRVKNKNKVLKLKVDKDWYYRIGLSKNNKQKFYFIHRLVAQAFIPNPNDYPQVNHKDQSPNKKLGIFANNNVANLEWCDCKYNNNYGTVKELKRKAQLNRIDVSKVILQYDLDGNFIKEWKSQKEIERSLGFKQANISDACTKLKTHQSFGYMWYIKETEEYGNKISKYINPRSKPVYQYDLNYNFIKFFENGTSQVQKELNLTTSQRNRINAICNGCRKQKQTIGFIWSYYKLTDNFVLDNDTTIVL